MTAIVDRILVPTVPCEHIALYYRLKHAASPCIAYRYLYIGYAQWSRGEVEVRFGGKECNNLWVL